jgi:hypothetical protein
MSAWRKQALEILPENRQLIEKVETPMELWVELQWQFSADYKNLGDDLIGRFYKYAKWCIVQMLELLLGARFTNI